MILSEFSIKTRKRIFYGIFVQNTRVNTSPVAEMKSWLNSSQAKLRIFSSLQDSESPGKSVLLLLPKMMGQFPARFAWTSLCCHHVCSAMLLKRVKEHRGFSEAPKHWHTRGRGSWDFQEQDVAGQSFLRTGSLQLRIAALVRCQRLLLINIFDRLVSRPTVFRCNGSQSVLQWSARTFFSSWLSRNPPAIWSFRKSLSTNSHSNLL